MTVRHEAAGVLAAAVLGGVLLLLAEPGLGFVALAGTGAGVLLPPRARRLVGLVLALVGAAAVALAAWQSEPLLATGSLLVTVTAAVVVVRSPRWPPARGGESAAVRQPTDRDTWEALDRGEDPTA